MRPSTSSTAGTKTSVATDALRSALRRFLVPALLIATALISIFAVEIVVRLQVVLGDLASESMDGRLMTSLERLGAAKAIASRVANGLSMVALLGALAFASFGEGSRLFRFATLTVVVILLARAYFWSVA